MSRGAGVSCAVNGAKTCRKDDKHGSTGGKKKIKVYDQEAT